MHIETIWNNIELHEGKTFYEARGGAYTVYSDFLVINGIKGGRITKNTLSKAMNVINPTPRKIELAGCWGSSYVYGIITDKRITG